LYILYIPKYGIPYSKYAQPSLCLAEGGQETSGGTPGHLPAGGPPPGAAGGGLQDGQQHSR